MHTYSKLFTSSMFFIMPGMCLAHVQHEHGDSLRLALLHPFTGAEHLLGLLLTGAIIYAANRFQIYRICAGVFCILATPVLFSYSMSTAAIVSMDIISLGLLVFLRYSRMATVQGKS